MKTFKQYLFLKENPELDMQRHNTIVELISHQLRNYPHVLKVSKRNDQGQDLEYDFPASQEASKAHIKSVLDKYSPNQGSRRMSVKSYIDEIHPHAIDNNNFILDEIFDHPILGQVLRRPSATWLHRNIHSISMNRAIQGGYDIDDIDDHPLYNELTNLQKGMFKKTMQDHIENVLYSHDML